MKRFLSTDTLFRSFSHPTSKNVSITFRNPVNYSACSSPLRSHHSSFLTSPYSKISANTSLSLIPKSNAFQNYKTSLSVFPKTSSLINFRYDSNKATDSHGKHDHPASKHDHDHGDHGDHAHHGHVIELVDFSKFPKQQKDIYQTHIYHYTGIGLIATIPTAIFFQGTPFSPILDVALAFLLPAHGYLGTKLIIDDYLPGSKFAHWLLILLTFLAGFGLLNINMSGEGVSGTATRLWRKKPLLEE